MLTICVFVFDAVKINMTLTQKCPARGRGGRGGREGVEGEGGVRQAAKCNAGWLHPWWGVADVTTAHNHASSQ